jgi:hypothetical protein
MNAIHQLLAYESTRTSMNLRDDSIKQKNMTLSIEKAKTRLADYNILLKYISFLQDKVVF